MSEARQEQGTWQEAEGLSIDKTPAALTLLKDWSAWLVGIQTVVFALIAFVAGKDTTLLTLTHALAKALVVLAIVGFALSTICATIILGQIPTIRQRMSKNWPEEKTSIWPEGNFYREAAFHGARWPFSSVKLWWITALEHSPFVAGILLVGAALVVETIWGTPARST